MIIPHHMSGKTVAILGLGRSGISACDALLMAGAICYVHDDQMIPDHTPQEAIIAAPDQWPWDDIDALVMSPGIPTRYPAPHPVAEQAQARQIPIISDIELFMNADIAARVIGITGTNGKSTTTALVAHIINQCGIPTITGGNIGTPVMALNDPGADGIIVLELSSYQLEITPSLRLDAAAILNITPDHLDRHGGWDGYRAAKEQIAHAVTGTGGLIVGTDNACQDIAATFSHIAISIDPDVVSAKQPNINLPPALKGGHNLMNIAAAMLICDRLDISVSSWEETLSGFKGLAHRMEWLGQRDGIQFVNDSKATNGIAAAKALTSYPAIYWIVGGQMKEDGLGDTINALDHVRHAFVIGAEPADCVDILTPYIPVNACHTIEQATQSAYAKAHHDQIDGATVLLSPAAASFDQFKNFEHRGDCFRAAVNHILAETHPMEHAHV